MIQQVVTAFLTSLRILGGTAMKLAPALALFVAALVVGMLVLYATDRDRFDRLRGDVSRVTALMGWMAVLVVGSTIWLTLPKIRTIVTSERVAQDGSTYSSTEDPSVSQVMQAGPLATYVQERTFSRTLTLPPDFLERIGSEGVQVLSPYLQDPSAENVLELADTFRRSGTNVIFTREVKRLDATPVPIDEALVEADLQFRSTSGARRSYYNATFDASYTFANPLEEEAECRFAFPLPQAGTIRDFSLSVNGETVKEANEGGLYEWKGRLPGGGKATAKVSYRTQGGQSWHYELGSGRRRTGSMTVRVKTNEPTRFLRGALFPTSREGDTMVWNLKNVITNREIDLNFAGRGAASDAESKAMTFIPFSFALFLLAVAGAALRGRDPLDSSAVLLGMVGYSVGLFSVPILLQYVPLIVATLLSAAVAAVLARQALGQRSLFPALFTALLPLVFVSDQHSGLLGLLAGIIGLLAISRRSEARA